MKKPGAGWEVLSVANFKNPFSRIRLVYRRSSTLLKCVVLAAIVLSMAALLALRASIQTQKQEQEDLRHQAAILEEENRELEDRIDKLGSVQSVEQIAQDELDLVDPDTVILDPVE